MAGFKNEKSCHESKCEEFLPIFHVRKCFDFSLNDDGSIDFALKTAECLAYCCKGCASLKIDAKLDQKQ
jgi:hypothetical protein